MGSVLGRQASAEPVGNHGDGKIRGSMQAEAAAGKVSEGRNSVNNSISNDDGNSNRMENEEEWSLRPKGERRRSKPNPRLSNPPKHLLGEQVAAGWPSWLSAVAGEAINGWTPRRAHTFEKIDKRRRLITHANVKSKSEKFPPPHQDGTLGYPLGSSDHIDPAFDPLDVSFSSTSFSYSEESVQTWSGPLVKPAAVGAPRRKQRSSGQIHLLSKPLRKDSKR